MVLDLTMPEMNGFEFLKRFRGSLGGRRKLVIVWTVKDLTPMHQERRQAAAQGVVSKGQGTTLVEELQPCVPLSGKVGGAGRGGLAGEPMPMRGGRRARAAGPSGSVARACAR